MRAGSRALGWRSGHPLVTAKRLLDGHQRG